MAGWREFLTDPCPCGSGKRYQDCCFGKGLRESQDMDRPRPRQARRRKRSRSPTSSGVKYPLATVAFYGPDDKTTTKIAAGVFLRPGAEIILKRWVSVNVRENPKVEREMLEFFHQYGVQLVIASDGNIGCPHEEGPDFPLGEDCPFCPFWKGKQGSNRRM